MPKPKNIINDPKDAVTEYIDGLLYQYPNHLSKLENHNVVLLNNSSQQQQLQLKNSNKQCVHLICGGGSGHEPSHAGFVGTGMLSGAVCGGIFASPSVASILAAIRAVHSSAVKDASSSASKEEEESNEIKDTNTITILLIIKNYTGDRLNFGMAAERANQEGIETIIHIVADDCALSRTKGITGARGVAGTVVVNKIIGAAAYDGQSIETILQLTKILSNNIGTIGIALNSVTIPGSTTTNDRLINDNIIEIGLGIHGEAGLKQSSMLSANDIAQTMISHIQEYGRNKVDNENDNIVPLFDHGDELCIVVNNLGGISIFEMSIVTRSIVSLLESTTYNTKVSRVLVGTYMTSFNMQGISLTIVNIQNQLLLKKYLDAPCTAPAWKSIDIWDYSTTYSTNRPSSTIVPEIKVNESASVLSLPLPTLGISNFDIIATKMVHNAAEALLNSESLLTQYDTIVGDGDCGITMQRGAKEIIQRLNNGTIVMTHPVLMFASIADAVSISMGGTSGILIEIMMRKISSSLSKVTSTTIITPKEIAIAFQAGVDAVSFYGGASIGSRTMLDALIPAALSLVSTSSYDTDDGCNLDLTQASIQARNGANTTSQMEYATAGRSNYLSSTTLIGTPDPGAIAVAIVLEAIAAAAAASNI